MTLRTLNYGNYGIFLIMGNAGFCPSTVGCTQTGPRLRNTTGDGTGGSGDLESNVRPQLLGAQNSRARKKHISKNKDRDIP